MSASLNSIALEIADRLAETAHRPFTRHGVMLVWRILGRAGSRRPGPEWAAISMRVSVNHFTLGGMSKACPHFRPGGGLFRPPRLVGTPSHSGSLA